MSLEQIAMMAAAAKTLKEGGAYDAHLYGKVSPHVHLPAEKFVTAVADTHIRPSIAVNTGSGPRWRVVLTHQGVVFFALMEPQDLPRIGYHLVDGRPVPITDEEAQG